MNRDWIELTLVSVIVLTLVWACIVVVIVLGPPIKDTLEARPYGPEIPQCDEPLWDRIKDRCV